MTDRQTGQGEEKMETQCERCGAVIERDTAYRQTEWTTWSGKRVKCSAYYCETCRHLLATIGEGEYTALQERADA